MDSRSDAPTFCGLALFPGGEVFCSMKDNTVCVANSSSLIYYENNNQASVSKKLVEMSTMAGTQAQHTLVLNSMRSPHSLLWVLSQIKQDPWLQHRRKFQNELIGSIS